MLDAYEFLKRDATKEDAVWSSGTLRFTMTNVHGGRPLGPKYVSKIIQLIEQSQAYLEEQAELDKREAENEDDE